MSMNDLALIIQPLTYVIYIDRNEDVINICNSFDYEECPYKFMNVINISVGNNYSLVITLDTIKNSYHYSIEEREN